MVDSDAITLEQRRAIVRIEARINNQSSLGTGFFIGPKNVLTAYHVVASRRDSRTPDGNLIVKVSLAGISKALEFRYVDGDRDKDWALLELAEEGGSAVIAASDSSHLLRDVQPLSCDVMELGPGLNWRSFGYPKLTRDTGNTYLGRFMKASWQEVCELQWDKVETIGGQPEAVSGLSGAPLFVDGCVVGIMTQGELQDRPPADTSPPLSSSHKLWALPLAALFAGDTHPVAKSKLAELTAGIDLIPPQERELPAEPFVGIRSFEKGDARIFFGRSQEVHKIVKWLNDPSKNGNLPVLILYGLSGVGKSSLLQAGLLPRLKDWDVVFAARNKDVGLSQQLTKECPLELPANQTSRLIVLDQVEQCFTQPSKSSTDNALKNPVDTSQNYELVELVDAVHRLCGSAYRVILSLRSDWYAQVQKAFETKNPQNLPSYMLVEGLSDRGFEEAVLGLMRWQASRDKYQLDIKRELVTTLQDRIGREDPTPKSVILQIMLTHMWERVKSPPDEKRRAFDKNLHSQVWNASAPKHPLDFHFDQMLLLAQSEPKNEELFTSGLALDVLEAHTSDHRTAYRQELDHLRAIYKHRSVPIDDLAKLLGILTSPSVRLLIRFNPDKPATSLVHDLLAPIIRERHRQSQRPGQAARFLLEGHTQAQKETLPLSPSVLKRVEAGRAGMRTLTAGEEKLLKDSKAKRRRDRVLIGSVILLVPVLLAVLFRSYLQQDARLKRIRALADADPTTAALLLRETPSWYKWFEDGWRLLGMKVLQQPLSNDRWYFSAHRPLALASSGQQALAMTDRQVVLLDRTSGAIRQTELPAGRAKASLEDTAGMLFESKGSNVRAVIRWDKRLFAWDLAGPLVTWSVDGVSGFTASVDGEHVLAWRTPEPSDDKDGAGDPNQRSSATSPSTAVLEMLDGKTGRRLAQGAVPGLVLDAAFDSSGAWVVVLVQTPDRATELLSFASAAPLAEGKPIYVGPANPTALAAHPTESGRFLVLTVPQAWRHKPDDGTASDDGEATAKPSHETEGPAAKAENAVLFGDTQLRSVSLDDKGVGKVSGKLAEGAYPRDRLLVSPQRDYLVLSDRLGDEAVMLAGSLLHFSQQEGSSVGLNPLMGSRHRELQHVTLHDPDSPIHAMRFVGAGEAATQLATLSGGGIRYWNPAGQLADLKRKVPLRVASGFSGAQNDYIDCGPAFWLENGKQHVYLSCRRYRADAQTSYDLMIPADSLLSISQKNHHEKPTPSKSTQNMGNWLQNQLCAKQERLVFFGKTAILDVDVSVDNASGVDQNPVSLVPKLREIPSDLPIEKVTCDLQYAIGIRQDETGPIRVLLKHEATADRFRTVASAQSSVGRRDLCGSSTNFVGSDLGGSPSAALVVCKDAIYRFSPPDSTTMTRISLSAPTSDAMVTNAGYNEHQSLIFHAIGQQAVAEDPEGGFLQMEAVRIRPQRLLVSGIGGKVTSYPIRAWPPLSSTSLDISNDGKWFAVPQGEHVRLAKLADPTQYVDLGYGGIPSNVQFSPHGEWLEASSIAGPGQRWPLSPRAIACSLWQLSTCLSAEERIYYDEERPAQARAQATPQACTQQRQKNLRECPAPEN